MKMNSFPGTIVLPAMLVLLFTSCTKEVGKGTAEEQSLSNTEQVLVADGDQSKAAGRAVAHHAESELLKSVRTATSRFHSTTQAIKAGYEPSDECVYVPGLGGMGYHWVNPLLVDGVFDPLEPEAVLYAPGPGGKLKLIAVEYIVVKGGQAAPTFGSQAFDDGGTPLPMPHWSLHAWIHENNPSGMFAPFNPNVSCP
jgi:hypothetical protein